MENEFKVHISVRNTVMTICGEENNVLRCAEAVEDMLEETELVINLSPAQMHALLAHDNKYRRQIEETHRVFISLKGVEGIILRGGVKAVKNGERAVNDLFRSK